MNWKQYTKNINKMETKRIPSLDQFIIENQINENIDYDRIDDI